MFVIYIYLTDGFQCKKRYFYCRENAEKAFNEMKERGVLKCEDVDHLEMGNEETGELLISSKTDEKEA